MNQRVKRLLDALKVADHQAVLVHHPSNMFYLSGYRGEGCLLLCAAGCWVVTDFRYTEQAEKQAPGFDVLMIEGAKTHEERVGELCGKQGVNTLFYEDDFLTVHGFAKCKEAIKGMEWKGMGDAVAQLRVVKDERELALIEKACQITSGAFERILPQIKVGVTEREIAALLEFDMKSHGAEGTSFGTIVAAGVNGSLPHAMPGDYRVRSGDLITMDFGAMADGYTSDMTRNVALGQPSDEMKKVYQTVQQAQQMTQDAVAAGKSCREIDAMARNYIHSQGYEGRFGHGLGHSLGIDVHENPRCNTISTAMLQENMLMTVEPGIYLPGVGGVRIENTVVVTKDGCRALTTPTRDLVIL